MRGTGPSTAALVALVCVASGACAGPGDSSAVAGGHRAAVQSSSVTSTMPAEGNMGGVNGMNGMNEHRTDGMRNALHRHMTSMMRPSSASMKSMVPVHRQLVADMITQMSGEMHEMNIAGNTEWKATADSLRKDLIRMPELSNAELTVMMPAHAARVLHLRDTHQQLMRSMNAK